MRMRRPDPFDRRAMALSVGLHVALFGFGWLSTLYEPPVFEFVSYQIEMVSPPPAQRAEEPTEAAEELVVERPQPTPPAPERAEPVPRPRETQPERTPPPREEPPAEERPVAAEERREAASPQAPEEAEPTTESGSGINVRLEGLRRDYPEYYNNIIRQIQRCFRWQGGGSWETAVRFVIQRDGRVTDMEFASRSGNTAFDFEAMGAVDCAGQGRLGPLPDDLPYERLPIQFSFRPVGGIR